MKLLKAFLAAALVAASTFSPSQIPLLGAGPGGAASSIAAAQLATTGIDYTPGITISGGPPALTFTTNGGSGNIGLVRLSRACATSKTHIELNTTNWTGGLNGSLGVDKRTDDFSTTSSSSPYPGKSDSTGFMLDAFDGFVWNSNGNTESVTQPVNGDVIAVEWDTTNISFYKVHSGVTTQLGSTHAHGLGTAALWLLVGQGGGGSNIAGTINTTGPYAMTPTAGYGNC